MRQPLKGLPDRQLNLCVVKQNRLCCSVLFAGLIAEEVGSEHALVPGWPRMLPSVLPAFPEPATVVTSPELTSTRRTLLLPQSAT